MDPAQYDCPDCGEPTSTTWDGGQCVCAGCGVIVKSKMVESTAEWRGLDPKVAAPYNTAARCAPVGDLLPSLHTSSANHTSKRLRQVQHWNNVPLCDRSLCVAYGDFKKTCSRLRFPDCVARTMFELYSRISKIIKERQGIKKSHLRPALRAACMYFALRQTGTPYERREIAELLDVPQKIVTKGYNLFLDLIGAEFRYMRPLCPIDFLERFWIVAESMYFKDDGTGENPRRVLKGRAEAARILEDMHAKRACLSMFPSTVAVAVICVTLQRVHGTVPEGFIERCNMSIGSVKKCMATIN
ncbi:hypothetical protein GGF32_003806 [Allomyces javanicus]|nr:hypothetical protein GGF32_003806 [Allomyces javanicus]